MTAILIFGDSITWGAWDRKGGWAERLKSFTNEKNLSNDNYYCEIYNLGVGGNTVEDLIKRVEPEIFAREGEEETIIIFAIGLNDSQMLNAGPRFSIEDFRKNLNVLVKKCEKFSPKILFLGLTPVDESKVNPILWKPEKSYQNENVKKFNEELKSFCERENFGFIEIFEEFIKKDYKRLLEDGLHPNSEGHKMMFEIIKDFLISKKII